MKRTVIALSIIFISAIGFSAFAQSQQNAPEKERRVMKGQKPEMQRPNLFEGITLSADQQSQLDNLRKTRQFNDSTARKEAKRKRDEMRKAQVQKRDEMMKARQQKKRDYLNSVKAILTPEQYVVFLENIIVNQPCRKGNVRQDRPNKRKSERFHHRDSGHHVKDMKKHGPESDNK